MSNLSLKDAAEKAAHVEMAQTYSDTDLSDDVVRATPQAVRRVILKQDLILLPLLSFSYFFAYLDRGQIGNARVLGMQKDLGLSGQQFYNIIMMFFVGYMIIELPAGIAMRYMHPRYVFAGALLVFGTCAACLSVAHGYAAAVVLRLLVGLGEAFINNAWLMISVWYKPDELALRSAMVYFMTPIAGAISGVLAYAVGRHLDHASGMHSWQWLFIIEGVATVAFALIVLVAMPGMPDRVAEQGSWLFKRDDERQIILNRYQQAQNSKGSTFQAHQVWMAIKDPKVYLGAIMTGAQGVGIGAFSVFLPTFIKAFGFSVLETQLFSMIPYAFGLLFMVVFALMSDRLLTKSYMIMICLSITSIGFIILLATTNKIALVAGSCFVTAGAYPGLVISTSFNLPIHAGYTKRATVVWITQVFIQGLSMISSQVYRSPPRFFLGHGFSLGTYVVSIICTYALRCILARDNAAKQRRKDDFDSRGELDHDAAKSFEELGDFHPRYIYTL